MALARLSKISLELQYLVSTQLGPSDLLSLSHVSVYWRAFVLDDNRWAEWYSGIVSHSDESLQEFLARFNIPDVCSARKMVYLCLRQWCMSCGDYSQDIQIYLPHMKRLCDTCLADDKYTVLSFSAAIAKYDLRERDATGVLILEWCNPNRVSKRAIKLVSEAHIKQIALRQWITEANLEAHLSQKKASALATYRERSEDYRSAVSTREALQETGNVIAADSVVIARTGRKIPKAFPAYPKIILPSKPTDRKVVCFAPRPLVEVDGDVWLDVCDSDSEDELSANPTSE
ncbi:hypothetical protein R3P38DRAFT_3341351 [Favolaschia claudopus]|uniref:F-box domain-containing protein n=1 Tax=Favolaschia claudopus TaxID=2862362 RepID=A0AAW0E3B6_9AGAR